MKINAAKTQFIIFKAANKKLPEGYHVELDNCQILPSDNVKLLGITLDKHLTFKTHIDAVAMKCHGLIGVLARSAPFMPTKLLRLSYESLVRSQLEYCSAVFASAAPTHLHKLDIIQKIASRIITRSERCAHSAPLLESLGLESLLERRNAHIIDLVKQFISGNCHPAMTTLLATTHDNKLASHKTATRKIGRRCFSVHAALIYNSKL